MADALRERHAGGVATFIRERRTDMFEADATCVHGIAARFMNSETAC